MKLEKIRELCDKATRGPWIAASDMPYYAVWARDAARDVVQSQNRITINNPMREWTRENDAVFIAAARMLLPLLLDVAEAAKCSAPIWSGGAYRPCRALKQTCEWCGVCRAQAALESADA